jgi:hypothetical protein
MNVLFVAVTALAAGGVCGFAPLWIVRWQRVTWWDTTDFVPRKHSVPMTRSLRVLFITDAEVAACVLVAAGVYLIALVLGPTTFSPTFSHVFGLTIWCGVLLHFALWLFGILPLLFVGNFRETRRKSTP